VKSKPAKAKVKTKVGNKPVKSAAAAAGKKKVRRK
jgi:hypothetical protein